MGIKKTQGFATVFIITVSVILLATNFILGAILINYSKTAMKTLINNRMLDISNTAAYMLDGDELESLTAEDVGTPEYDDIFNTLKFFQDSIELKYIYGIHDDGDGKFSFTVDPAEVSPGEFGEPVVTTEALIEAGKGTPMVDEEPYSDDWGKFYSAYSPVFDSQGKVAGIIAVDFSAEWYDEQIAKQTWAIVYFSVISLVISILLVFVATGRLRRQIGKMTEDISEVARGIDDLNREINNDVTISIDDKTFVYDIPDLGEKILRVKDGLDSYTNDIHSRANNMITALSSIYRGVYYIDLDDDEGICYQVHSNLGDGLKMGGYFPYFETMKKYADSFVTEGYRDEFLKFVEPDALRQGLLKERVITFRYTISINGQESYEMLRITGIRLPEDRDDQIHAVGMSFADVDAETRRTLNQSIALRDALSAAEGANKAKTTFLSNISHEFRTPMNAIIGLDRIALNDPGLSENSRDSLVKIGDSAEHLLGIINDILDMSRIEAGKMTIIEETFSIVRLIDKVNDMIEGQCRDKGLELKHEVIGSIGEYYVGDDVKLEQVLINILSNAVKFTDRGGEVYFSVERTSQYDGRSVFRFVVKDTGIGMSEDFLPGIFEPFSQENLTAGNKYGSIGLGMPITKSIVDMMNGEIDVASSKGAGTTFVVKFTFLDSDQRIDDTVEESAQDEASDNRLEGRRVLLAEDVEVNAQIVRMILEMRSVITEHAVNGKVAVDMFKEHPQGYYDAILMDMRMPKMDGIEASRMIREMDRADAGTIPIIALTANAFDEDVQRSLQAGLNAHLSKPIEPEVLFETLEKLV